MSVDETNENRKETEKDGEEHEMVIAQGDPGILILLRQCADRDAQDQGGSNG